MMLVKSAAPAPDVVVVVDADVVVVVDVAEAVMAEFQT